MIAMKRDGVYDVPFYLGSTREDLQTLRMVAIYMETLKYFLESEEIKELKWYLCYGMHRLSFIIQLRKKGDNSLFEYLFERKMMRGELIHEALAGLEDKYELCPMTCELENEQKKFEAFKSYLIEKYEYVQEGEWSPWRLVTFLISSA